MSGYIDLQVNGYAGVDFNADKVTDQQWSDVCGRLRADGVGKFLPTVITAPWDKMIQRIRNIADAIDRRDMETRQPGLEALRDLAEFLVRDRAGGEGLARGLHFTDDQAVFDCGELRGLDLFFSLQDALVVDHIRDRFRVERSELYE